MSLNPPQLSREGSKWMEGSPEWLRVFHACSGKGDWPWHGGRDRNAWAVAMLIGFWIRLLLRVEGKVKPTARWEDGDGEPPGRSEFARKKSSALGMMSVAR